MKTFLTLILGTACISAYAQEFKEGLLYDVCGNVKEVSLQRNGEAAFLATSFFDSAKFNPDGKTERSLTVFDDNGYPISLTIDPTTLDSDGNGVSTNSSTDSTTSSPDHTDLCIALKFNYDKDHRLSCTSLKYNIDLSDKGIPFKKSLNSFKTFQYTPNASGKPEIRSAKGVYNTDTESDAATQIDSVYSNYVYDKHGNWISRSVKETIVGTDKTEEGKSWEYEETRTITYYD